MTSIETFQELESVVESGVRVLDLLVVTPDYEFSTIFNMNPLMSGKFSIIGPKVIINMPAVHTDIRDNERLEKMREQAASIDLEAYRAYYYSNS